MKTPLQDIRYLPRAVRVCAWLLAVWVLFGAGTARALYVPWAGDVRVSSRDTTTANIHFNLAFGGWRNEVSRGGAWVFFKVQAEGRSEWQTVRLAADRVVNPKGYSAGDNSAIELVVPDGEDGFTGLFVLPAKGRDSSGGAENITVVWDFTANTGITKDTKVTVRSFAIAMAYVAEGPFTLGSGGTEWNRFYTYTDGSQHTRPYRVMGPGAIPTGRQDGRLWARKGAQPEDGGEIPATFPNGYAGFYCMMFNVTYAQYTGFLNTLPAEVADRYHVPAIKPYYVWYNHAGTQPMRIVRTSDPAQDPFTVEIHAQGRWNPAGTWDRDFHGMSWADGAAYAAWAGLRPMSELEFEKACRGPRDPVPEETGPSYWNITSFPGGAGPGAQWPAHRRHTDRAVTVANPEGRGFKGTHGRGTWTLPADWPQEDAVGAGFRGGGMSMPGSRLSDRLYAGYADPRRRPYCSFRCVRTAPKGEDQVVVLGADSGMGDGSVLALEPLPDLRGFDISILQLTGSFQSIADQPQQVVLSSPLPESCFQGGAGVLSLTATPTGATPFKILTTLTRKDASRARSGPGVPFRITTPEGVVLAEKSLGCPLEGVAPFVISSLAGGTVSVRITNATDRVHTLAITLQPPPGLAIPEPERRLEMGAGKQAQVSFPVPRQSFRASGACLIPYTVTLGDDAPQSGEVAAELRSESRWWISRRIQAGPALGGDSLMSDPGGLDVIGDAISVDAFVDDNSVFKAGARPKEWTPVVYGGFIPVGEQGALPTRGSCALAATRVTAPVAREVLIDVHHEIPWGQAVLPSGKKVDFSVRVWFNSEVVFDSTREAQKPATGFHMRKGTNTLLVECRSKNDESAQPGQIFVTFRETGEDAREVEGLILNMESEGK